MNELEKYRDERASVDADLDAIDWGKGFDAAIALDLPVKFAKWKDSNTGHVAQRELFVLKHTDRSVFYTYSELYKYWIDNIYKIE